ncbi:MULTISPECIES: spore coat protein CotF [Bacillus]|uniref:Spore coat protein CotF n=1 Tax=Bacillus cabrialesii subsp. tritici TaxID=2944916 RepID=A0ABT9DRX9_9BACI|nr:MULTISPECIES: spore coat protein CotF [Bacillus]OLQ55834.1 spore coat protein [Bacillus licheniformis]RJS55341.1 spore coat protein [Bacillus subtilis]MBU2659331.1 spore coat protein CotF [Bacillus cabrialesii]MDO8227441.1 spore coat protein CotF [Bacillus cabrialesii subsp. tritici]MDU0156089.1 spore coat protein CotF [Bacillus cabrialesii]
MDERRTLAWHETLEMHELVAFQSNGLIKLKKMIREVKDPQLRQLYSVSIQAVEQNLRELLPFFPQAPHREDEEEERADNPFYSGDLLGFAKTSVRSYAIAITETATPQLRNVLVKQLNAAIQLHAQIFQYMYQHGYYPAYNLSELLRNDVRNANRALSMK